MMFLLSPLTGAWTEIVSGVVVFGGLVAIVWKVKDRFVTKEELNRCLSDCSRTRPAQCIESMRAHFVNLDVYRGDRATLNSTMERLTLCNDQQLKALHELATGMARLSQKVEDVLNGKDKHNGYRAD